MLNIALFAARDVGLEIAKCFGENNESPTCMVLDVQDKPAFRSSIISAAGIEKARVYTSDLLYDNHTLTSLRRMNLDLIILAWWPYIIKEQIWGIPKLGCLNFHPSLLPFNKGKHYNFWTIVEDVPFGVTLHFVDNGIDTGPIAFQREIEKTWEDTGKTLYERAQKEIVQLFQDHFSRIKEGNIPRFNQDPQKGSFHAAKELAPASQIVLDRKYSARELLNLLRARTFPPHPGAWFMDNGKKYQVRVSIERVQENH